MKHNLPQKNELKKAFSRFNVRLVTRLAALIIVALAVFRLLENLGLYVIAVTLYSLITLATALWYIIYNKGNVSGRVTPDMLPAEWSAEKKQELIDDLAARRKKSKWAFLILIPMIVVFGAEMLRLYVLPLFNNFLTALGLELMLGQ